MEVERRQASLPPSHGTADIRSETDERQEILEVYEDHIGEVYAYCLRRLLSAHLAEEAAASVAIRLVESYPRLKQQGKCRQDIRQWLYGTASNVIARFLRDSRRRREIAGELARRQQSMQAANVQDNGRLDWPVLYQAIARLPGKDQDLLIMRYFQGLETSTIARAMGMNHGTVRSRLTRAVRRLRDDLEVSFGH